MAVVLRHALFEVTAILLKQKVIGAALLELTLDVQMPHGRRALRAVHRFAFWGHALLSARTVSSLSFTVLACIRGERLPCSEISDWDERVLNSRINNKAIRDSWRGVKLCRKFWPRSSRPRRRIATNPESWFFGAQDIPRHLAEDGRAG